MDRLLPPTAEMGALSQALTGTLPHFNIYCNVDLYLMKVMVSYFVCDTHKVMLLFLSCLFHLWAELTIITFKVLLCSVLCNLIDMVSSRCTESKHSQIGVCKAHAQGAEAPTTTLYLGLPWALGLDTCVCI